MESWYFIEKFSKEKEKNILKEIEINRKSEAIKKRDSRKFYSSFIKPFLFLFKIFFYFIRKKEIDIE